MLQLVYSCCHMNKNVGSPPDRITSRAVYSHSHSGGYFFLREFAIEKLFWYNIFKRLNSKLLFKQLLTTE